MTKENPNKDMICMPKLIELKRLYYCPYCHKKTKCGIQQYYDYIFCMECKKIKATVASYTWEPNVLKFVDGRKIELEEDINKIKENV